jgi:hypothetical protein
MARSPSERTLIGRIGAETKWAQCEDPTAATAPGRAKFDERFYDEVDPERVLPEAERERRAGHARKAYFAKLALASAKARRRKKSVNAKNADPDSRRSSKTASDTPDAVRAE